MVMRKRGKDSLFLGLGNMAAVVAVGAGGDAGPQSLRVKRLLVEEDFSKVDFETSEEVDVTPTFDSMGLREDLLRGIYAYGACSVRLPLKSPEGSCLI